MLAAVPQATAETFTLTNGRVIEGTVLRSLGNTISIKYEGAGMLHVPIGGVRQVEIATEDGGVVSGRLTGWSDGTYRLSTEEGPVEARVENGVAVALIDKGDESCGSQTETSAPSETESRPQRAENASGVINAGFVFAGSPDDGGRTFMQDRGRQALGENPKVSATSSLEIESEDGDQVVGAVDRLIEDGANLVFLAANDSAAAVTQSAKRHRDVRFIHCGLPNPVANIDVMCGRIYQARYLSGIIAGGMTETNLIGYVAAKPTPEVIVGINAFALSVQSVNPSADVVVRWTNFWYAPLVARQRAEELVDLGADILTIHQDSPAALQVKAWRCAPTARITSGGGSTRIDVDKIRQLTSGLVG